ncbi:MAG: NAD(+)/NADH kinase [Acutalibacteraceae bacterium]|nr:NAD(+)/NADH kinase [Acutalibacteraceae bacterium]
MKVAVFFNPDGVRDEIKQKLFDTLHSLDFKYYLADFNNADDTIEKCDIVLALGGDGTIMHAAKRAALHNKKILGINCGHLGYNAGLEANELNLLYMLKIGEYKVDYRMMLKITIGDKNYYCVNDAVVCKGALSRMIEINATFGGAKMHYRADGLIFSTPTGSTAYSLSAGGPAIEPTLDCISVTPICAHSLFSPPLVVRPDTEIVVEIDSDSRGDAYLTLDGETAIELDTKTPIKITKADVYAHIVRIKDDGFLKILKEKIK